MNEQLLLMVQQLLAACAQAHDADDADGVAACFAEDGVMAVWMRGEPDSAVETRGRSAIAEHTLASIARKTAPRRHLVSTSLVLASEADSMSVRTYFQVWEIPEGRVAELVTTGTYHDVVTTGDEPLLHSRGIELDAAPFPAG